MKKGWKIFWIICGITVVSGFACCMIALGLGVTSEAVAERLPNSIVYVNNQGGPYVGDDQNVSETYNGITDIDVQLSVGELQIKESDTDKVKFEATNIDSRLKLNYYVDEGELVVETRKHIAGLNGGNFQGVVTLYLPKDFMMDEVDLHIGAGELYIDNISTNDLSIDVGAGEATINDFHALEADFQCGAGSITASGAAEMQLDVDCGVGDINMTLAGSEQDYSYELKCGVGEITIGGNNYSGLGRKKEIYNNTGKEISIDCGIGEVSMDFIQP